MALLDIELSEDDFKETTTRMVQFSKETDSGFEWKEYCPAVFRLILELQNLDFNDYMQSICGDEQLTHILSSGKCGIVHASSFDDRFVIKTLRKDELKMMLEILPNYYRHLTTYKGSLLAKLYGLHCISSYGGVKVYFAVSSNVVKSNFQIHKCYDLKGATGRSNFKVVTDNLCIQKDEDFDYIFYLDPLVRCRLLKQIKYDCEFLEAQGIMDYSFMLSVHTVAQHEGLLNCKRSTGGGSFSSGRSSTNGSCYSDMIADTSEGNSDGGLSLAYLCSPSESTIFGKEMPALAVQNHKHTNADGGAGLEEYYDVVLNFAIVDIFQSYNMMKRIEHVYKSIHYRSRSIGAVNPKAYSRRFQDFLKRVFQSEDSISSNFDDETMSTTSSRQSE